MSSTEARQWQHYYRDERLAKNCLDTMETVSIKLENLTSQAADRNGRKRDTFEQIKDLCITFSELKDFGERLAENQRRKERKIQSLQKENWSLRNSVVEQSCRSRAL